MKQKLRSMVVPSDSQHVLMQWDLSQAESWVVAYLSGDPIMQHALLHDDIHSVTAKQIYPDIPKHFTKKEVPKEKRYTGKKSNHMLGYRASAPRYVQAYNKEAVDLNLPAIDNRTGVFHRTKWLELYERIPKFWWPSLEEELRQSRTLRTPYGRLCTFFASWGNELFKAATAFKPQSTVADHFNGKVQRELGIKGGMLEVYKQFIKSVSMEKRVLRIINQSHDSILADVLKEAVEEVAPRVSNILHRPIIINDQEVVIPVDCEIGERWGELEPYKK